MTIQERLMLRTEPRSPQSESTGDRWTSVHAGWLRPFLIFIAASIFIFFRIFLLPGTPLVVTGDQAIFAADAKRILLGQVPFRDFFCFVLPGWEILYAGMFRMFGVQAWLMQGMLVCLGAVIASLITWISQNILRGFAAVLPALLFLAFDLNSALDATHHWYSTMFVLIATGLLLRGKSLLRIATIGSLCGISTLVTQSQGVLSLLAFGIYLILIQSPDMKRRILWVRTGVLLAPFLVIVLSFTGYFVYRAGLYPVYYDLGYFAIHFFSAQDSNTLHAYFLQLPHLHHPSDLIPVVSFVFIHLLVPFRVII